MAAKPQGATVESLMECPICLGKFEDPRVLACLHTLCRKCLDHHVSAHATDGRFQCPSCRHVCQLPKGGTAAVPKNFFVNSLGELLQQQSNQEPAVSSGSDQKIGQRRECHNSKRDKDPHGDARIFCTDCAKFYCDACKSSHMAFDEFREHEFIPTSDVSTTTVRAAEAKRNVPRCEQHPAQQLDIYCDTCRVPVCMVCCLLQHKQHEYREMAAVGEESRKQLIELAEAADKFVTKLEEHLEELRTSQNDIPKDFNKACQEVEKAAGAMRDLVTKREQYLIKQIRDGEKAVRLEANASYKNTELAKVSTQSLHTYMQRLLASGDITNQVVHTPGLKEQLRQQEAAPLRSVTWEVSFKEEAKSVVALEPMLGTVSVDHTMTTQSHGENVCVLGAPVNILKPNVSTEMYVSHSKPVYVALPWKEDQIFQPGDAVPTVAQTQRSFTPTQMRVTSRVGNPQQVRPTKQAAFQAIPGASQLRQTKPTGQQQVCATGQQPVPGKQRKIGRPGLPRQPRPSVPKYTTVMSKPPPNAASSQVAPQAIHVSGHERLTSATLASLPPQEQRQMLGERLFPLIQGMYPNLSGKITGMLLDLDNSELLHMLASRKSLRAKVDEAVAVLLASAPPQEQRQMLGECLFPLIQGMYPKLSGKITGMLLDLDNSKLLHMLSSKKSLRAKVEEAVAVLQTHQEQSKRLSGN